MGAPQWPQNRPSGSRAPPHWVQNLMPQEPEPIHLALSGRISRFLPTTFKVGIAPARPVKAPPRAKAEDRLQALLRAGDLLASAADPRAVLPDLARLLAARLDANVHIHLHDDAHAPAAPEDRHARHVPLAHGHGVLHLARPDGFSDDDLADAAHVARLLGDALERHRLHRHADETRARFERVTGATEDVLWEWNLDDGEVWRNTPTLAATDGNPLSPILPGAVGRWLSRVHPDERARVGASLRAAIEGADPRWRAEYRVDRGDGSYAIVLDRARILRDDTGRARRVVGSVQDVTQRREAENAALLQKVLLESQNEAALDGIFFQGADGRAVFYNRRLLEMWGVDESVPQGPTVEERLSRVVNRLADPQAFIDKVLALEKDRDATFRDDLRTADGRIFDCYAAPVRTRDGSYAGRVWFYRDVTARRRMEEELADARRHLAHSEKLAALGTLVSGVAHEIRTPLAYVSNQAYLVQWWIGRLNPAQAPREDDIAKLRNATASIIEGVDRMNRLVNDLRRFSRLDAGDVPEIDVDDAVRSAIDLFAATHRHRARVNADLRSASRARIDRGQIQQVILNLLENAADASPAGAAATVRTWTEDGALHLSIEDQGPGIPAQIQARMWEPFYTTKREGTGLGLSIVRRIAEANGGEVRCVSEMGKGARFVLRFPLGK